MNQFSSFFQYVARLKSLSVCNTALGLYATSALSHLPGIDSRRKHTQRLTGWATLDTGLLTVCFSPGSLQKSGTLLNEIKKSERAVHRHQNERVHSIVHQAVIQYVQFTFTKIMNEFMNFRSMNAFRRNTEWGCLCTVPHEVIFASDLGPLTPELQTIVLFLCRVPYCFIMGCNFFIIIIIIIIIMG